MSAVLEQAKRILTDRFCIGPFDHSLPEGLPMKGVSWEAVEGLTDAEAWERVYEPMWGILSQAVAHERNGMSMFQPMWRVERRPRGRLDLLMITEPDPMKVAEAMFR
jgi:hypothetical protein